MCHIPNEEADELMKIEDVYGERRKEDSEKVNHCCFFDFGVRSHGRVG